LVGLLADTTLIGAVSVRLKVRKTAPNGET
jgi:hypothetical protein